MWNAVFQIELLLDKVKSIFCSKVTVEMIRDGSAEVHFSAFPPLDMIETGIWIQRVQKRANEMYQCCYYKKLDFSSSV